MIGHTTRRYEAAGRLVRAVDRLVSALFARGSGALGQWCARSGLEVALLCSDPGPDTAVMVDAVERVVSDLDVCARTIGLTSQVREALEAAGSLRRCLQGAGSGRGPIVFRDPVPTAAGPAIVRVGGRS